jgi:glycerophosphoryl diester phosphodiesterase
LHSIRIPRRAAALASAALGAKGCYNLPLDAAGDAVAEYLTHFRLGVDGVFTDFADTALEARAKYLKEKGL